MKIFINTFIDKIKKTTVLLVCGYNQLGKGESYGKCLKNKALYHQLVDLLQERIETCMIPHDKLPSERELTAQYGVSRTTVRLALQELENRGSIYRRHGKGTFVSDIKKRPLI